MAFTSRAPRTDLTVQSSLPRKVGPGSYSPETQQRRRRGGVGAPGCVPFSSSQARRIDSDFCQKTPGPGSYLSTSIQDSRRAGPLPGYTRGPSKAFKSRVPRFDPRDDWRGDEPGPGNYQVPDAWTKQSSSQKHRDAAPTPRGPRVRFLRLPTAPSIPVLTQSYGYDENARGDLVQRAPPGEVYSGLRQDTVGPAYYDADLKAVKGTRMTDFHRSRSAREPFRARRAPGPGQYEPRLAIAGDFPGDDRGAARTASVFCSRTNRFEDRRFPVPGPGSYSHRNSFARARRSASSTRKQTMDGSARKSLFTSKEALAKPGPGAYDSRTTSFMSADEMRARGLAVGLPDRPAFCSSDKRFVDRRTPIPGPGSYQYESLHPRKSASRYGVFGSTAERATEDALTANMPPREQPGPGHYDHSLTPRAGPTRLNPNSIFMSESQRFPDVRSSGAPVGLYETPLTWERGTRKTSSAAPHRDFDSTEQRFLDGKRAMRQAAECPGPGSYTPSRTTLADHTVATTGLKSRASRFGSRTSRRRLGTRIVDRAKEAVPGPGHYASEAHAGFVKRSFNITIDND